MIRNIQHGFRIFSDVLSILFALGYCISIGFMLLFNIGEPMLNYMMLGLTAVFLVFLIFKLVLLKNKPKKSGKVSKYGKRTYKYIKYIMRLVNAIMIVVSVVNVNMWSGNIIAPLTTMLINIFGFSLMILFDIITYLFKKKISSKRAARQEQKLQEQQAKQALKLEKQQQAQQNPKRSIKEILQAARDAIDIPHSTGNSKEGK